MLSARDIECQGLSLGNATSQQSEQHPPILLESSMTMLTGSKEPMKFDWENL